jgi:hypothetical protein
MREPPRISSLDELRPDVMRRALAWQAATNLLLEASRDPSRVVVLETRRTPQRQDWLFASGRTRPGPRVTNLRGDHPKARHVAAAGGATALDFALKHPAKGLWDASLPWELAGQVGELLGFTWGGRWKTRDLGHLEFNA